MIESIKLIVVRLGIIKFVKIIVFVLLIYCCVMCLSFCIAVLLCQNYCCAAKIILVCYANVLLFCCYNG